MPGDDFLSGYGRAAWTIRCLHATRCLCVCYLNGAPLRDVPVAVGHGDFLVVYKSDSGRIDVPGPALAGASTRRAAASSVATSSCPSGHSALSAGDLNSESEHLPE